MSAVQSLPTTEELLRKVLARLDEKANNDNALAKSLSGLFSPDSVAEQTRRAVEKSIVSLYQGGSSKDVLAKATFTQSLSQTSGVTAYSLEPAAKLLIPLITPLRNKIPRKGGGTGLADNWRSVTAIDTAGTRPFVSVGHRSAAIAVTTSANSAFFKGMGKEATTDFEAMYASQAGSDSQGIGVGGSEEDMKAAATRVALWSMMLDEEDSMLWSNSSVAIGQAVIATTADHATGGNLATSTTYYLQCAALTPDGYYHGPIPAAGSATVASGGPGYVTGAPATTGVQGLMTRINLDGSSDQFGGGTGQMSAESSQAASGGGNVHYVSATVTPVKGAAGYAWFVGTVTGTERLAYITTIPSVNIYSLPSGTAQTAASLGTNDNSTNSLAYDGLITQAFSSSAAYSAQISGTLTADGSGGIVEIETMLQYFWDTIRMGPADLWVNSQQGKDMVAKVLSGSSSPAYKFNWNTEQQLLMGGSMVVKYYNRYTGAIVNIHIHPRMPPGIILATADTTPYPMSGIANLMELKTRIDYYQLVWPVVTRRWDSGVYLDGVLKHYFPSSLGILWDVRPG